MAPCVLSANAEPFVPTSTSNKELMAEFMSRSTIASMTMSPSMSSIISSSSDDDQVVPANKLTAKTGCKASDSDEALLSTDADLTASSDGEDIISSSENDLSSCTVYTIAFMLKIQSAVFRQAQHMAARGVPQRPVVSYSTRTNEQLPKCLQTPVADSASTTSSSRSPPQLKSPSKASGKLPVASPTSWSATQKAAKASSDSDEKVERAARSLLNKLTLEKFDSLYEQLATCGIQTQEHVAILMKEIFEKATLQHHFIPMYADLCVRLESDSRVADALGSEHGQLFRHLLLTQCQVSFEDLLTPRETSENESAVDQEELDVLCKRRALGNIKLVGQLMVRGMLHSRLLVQCCDELLSGKDVCPEALECLSALLTVTGPKFDTCDYKHHERFCSIFSRVAELARDKTVHSRVRFLLRDVLDLRQARWKMKACTEKGPMKLEEVKAAQQKDVEVKPAVKAAPPLKRREEETKAPRKPVVDPRAAETKEPREPSAAARLDKLKTIINSTVKETNVRRDHPAAACLDKPTPLVGSTVKELPQPAEEAPSAKSTTRTRKKKSTTKPKSSEDPAVSCIKAKSETKPEPEAQPQSKPQPVPEPAPAAAAAQAAPAGPVNPEAFDLRAFHKELSATLRDLCADRNVASAVRRVRAQNVPVKFQAAEFANIVTRAAEETRGPARRSSFAFAAGLAAADTSAFDKNACLNGISEFFNEVYEDLCTEVPRLPAIVSAELVPTLRSVLPLSSLNAILPEELRVAA